MSPLCSRLVPLSVCLATVLLTPRGFGQTGASSGTGTTTRPAPASSTQKSGTAGRTARAPLPDPGLLDGSTQAPEKKSERGMLGEFEIPGDEDARSGKVGGPQRPPGAGKGAQQDPGGVQIAIPGMPPLGLPSGGAGLGGAPGGLPSLSLPDPTKSGTSAGAGSGAPQTGAPPAGSGNASGPQMPGNDAGAGGVQVADLKTDGAPGGGGGAEGGVQKPKPVTIGDPARIITPAANAPGVIGAQTAAGNTQQADKATGGGGKPSSNDNGNRGVEKGRTMPSGL